MAVEMVATSMFVQFQKPKLQHQTPSDAYHHYVLQKDHHHQIEM
jgi:hypothetical protein